MLLIVAVVKYSPFQCFTARELIKTHKMWRKMCFECVSTKSVNFQGRPLFASSRGTAVLVSTYKWWKKCLLFVSVPQLKPSGSPSVWWDSSVCSCCPTPVCNAVGTVRVTLHFGSCTPFLRISVMEFAMSPSCLHGCLQLKEIPTWNSWTPQTRSFSPNTLSGDN